MKYAKILVASKSDSILAVIAGLPVDASGFFLCEDQMQNIEAVLEEASGFATLNAALSTKFDEQSALLATATANVATANATVAERDATIAKLTADLAAANSKAAEEFQNTSKDKDKTGKEKVAAHLDPNSSFNKAADNLYR